MLNTIIPFQHFFLIPEVLRKWEGYFDQSAMLLPERQDKKSSHTLKQVGQNEQHTQKLTMPGEVVYKCTHLQDTYRKVYSYVMLLFLDHVIEFRLEVSTDVHVREHPM